MEKPDGSEKCFENLTLDHRYSSVAFSGVSLLSLLVSIPTIVLSVHEYCIKNKLSALRTERLFLYLICGISLVSLIGCFHWTGPLSIHSTVAKHICSGIGFLTFLTLEFSILITLCMGVHFLIQVCKPKWIRKTSDKVKILARRLEAVYITSSLTGAFLLSPWPFIHNGFGYNLYICWIVDIDDKTCKVKTTSLLSLERAVIYVIFLAISLFSFCVVIAVHVLIWLKKRQTTNLYVWVYTAYLLLILVNILFTLILNHLDINDDASIRFVHITTLGIMPLTAGVFTLMAVIYVKYKSSSRQPKIGNVNHPNYGLISTDIDELEENASHLKPTSRIPTTNWKPDRPTNTSSGFFDETQDYEEL